MKKISLKVKWLLLSLLILISLLGCSTVSYYSQSVIGHSKLMLARQPIEKAIANSEGERKRQLELAMALRQFAVERLALPENKSYLNFVPLEREFPVWSVVAAPEFSLKPKQWCYPIIGCAAYRGYFSEQAAQQFAQRLQAKQYETEVGGAVAYSTLGWFDDPLIPPMIRHGDAYLAQIMFHELAHQQLYVKGNSAFNEAFATVVGEQGALLWLQENSPEEKKDYLQIMQVRNDFSELIKKTKQCLTDIYQSTLSEQQKRQEKEAAFGQLRKDYETLKAEKWAGKAFYHSWFDKPLNNARLASFATYRDLVPAFEALFKDCGKDYAAFYKVVGLQKGRGEDSVVANRCKAL